MEKLCALGEPVFAIVKDMNSFHLTVTQAVVRSMVSSTIILERDDGPFSTTRFEFPANSWGVDVFRSKSAATEALPGRMMAHGGLPQHNHSDF